MSALLIERVPIDSESPGGAPSRTMLQLTLNRPERGNALDTVLVDALRAAFDPVALADVALVVLRGAGENFCTGFDLSAIEAQSDGDVLLRFVHIELLLQAVYAAPCATLALVHGRTFGAGADLMTACSTRIAAPNALFRFPGWNFGIALGTRRLARRIGSTVAQDVLLRDHTIDAASAERMALVSEVVDVGGWAASIAEFSASIRCMSRSAIADLLEITVDAERIADVDLAAVVRTASRPGLGSRIDAYRKRERAKLAAATPDVAVPSALASIDREIAGATDPT